MAGTPRTARGVREHLAALCARIVGSRAVGRRALSKPSGPQLGQVLEVRQSLRIGEGLDVLRPPAVNAVAYGQLDDFAAAGVRDIVDGDDFRGNVPRTGVLANLVLDPL